MQNESEIYVSPELCAYVVRKSAEACYGVVGLASPNGVTLLSHILPPFLNRNGVEVLSTEDGYRINVFIVAEYGTTFSVIAKNLCDIIKYNLQKIYGIKPAGIRVFIKGVRISG